AAGGLERIPIALNRLPMRRSRNALSFQFVCRIFSAEPVPTSAENAPQGSAADGACAPAASVRLMMASAAATAAMRRMTNLFMGASGLDDPQVRSVAHSVASPV